MVNIVNIIVIVYSSVNGLGCDFHKINITSFCQFQNKLNDNTKFFHSRLVITINIHIELLSGKCRVCRITLLLQNTKKKKPQNFSY